MPALTRWSNMDLLVERGPGPGHPPPPRALLVVLAHGFTTALSLAHLLFASKGDRVYNDAGAFIAAQTTWSYLLQALLKRRTLCRLYKEMLEYSHFVESSTPVGSGFDTMYRRLRRVWATETALTIGVWAFYTASPFIFEFIHGIELGSKGRLSAMVYPTPCDLTGPLCFRLTFCVVALEWCVAAFAFASVESTNLVFYVVACKHFEVLGDSLAQVFSSAEAETEAGAETSSALRQCILRHQFLLRWSKEMTEVYEVPTFLRLGSMGLYLVMPILKSTIEENYVLDELPFAAMYGMLTIYAICWFADDLNRAMHDSASRSHWERGLVGQRRSLHIILTRSLRPVRTRAFWIENLSLRSFVDVLNRSYSALQTVRAARRNKNARKETGSDGVK